LWLSFLLKAVLLVIEAAPHSSILRSISAAHPKEIFAA